MIPWARQKAIGLAAGGYSQHRIAQEVGVAQATVSRWLASVAEKPRKRAARRDQGPPICGTCAEQYHHTTDPIYGATIEHCKCGSRTLSPGWAA